MSKNHYDFIIVGGGSAINAMVYSRGHRCDHDHWAALGNRGWG